MGHGWQTAFIFCPIINLHRISIIPTLQSSQPQTLCRPLSSSRGPVGIVGCSRTPQTCHAKGTLRQTLDWRAISFQHYYVFFRARIFDILSLIYGPPILSLAAPYFPSQPSTPCFVCPRLLSCQARSRRFGFTVRSKTPRQSNQLTSNASQTIHSDSTLQHVSCTQLAIIRSIPFCARSVDFTVPYSSA